MIKKDAANDLISQVTVESWKAELEKTSSDISFDCGMGCYNLRSCFCFYRLYKYSRKLEAAAVHTTGNFCDRSLSCASS